MCIIQLYQALMNPSPPQVCHKISIFLSLIHHDSYWECPWGEGQGDFRALLGSSAFLCANRHYRTPCERITDGYHSCCSWNSISQRPIHTKWKAALFWKEQLKWIVVSLVNYSPIQELSRSLEHSDK